MSLRFTLGRRLIAMAFTCSLFAFAGPAAAQVELPAHLRSVLPKGEVVARCESCGSDCFLVFACSAADTTCGRVLRLAGREGEAPRSMAEGTWVRTDLAGAAGLVRAFGKLTPDQVRAALEAVRTRVRPRENVRDLRLLAPQADGEDMVLALELAREGAGPGQSRVLRVHLAAGGAFVESRGIAPH